MRLGDTTHLREWMPMISQAALAVAAGLKGLIVAGVLLQIAIVTRLIVRLAWEHVSRMWNQWRSSRNNKKYSLAVRPQNFLIIFISKPFSVTKLLLCKNQV